MSIMFEGISVINGRHEGCVYRIQALVSTLVFTTACRHVEVNKNPNQLSTRTTVSLAKIKTEP